MFSRLAAYRGADRGHAVPAAVVFAVSNDNQRAGQVVHVVHSGRPVLVCSWQLDSTTGNFVCGWEIDGEAVPRSEPTPGWQSGQVLGLVAFCQTASRAVRAAAP